MGTVCVLLCSNGCGIDIAVKNGRIVDRRAPAVGVPGGRPLPGWAPGSPIDVECGSPDLHGHVEVGDRLKPQNVRLRGLSAQGVRLPDGAPVSPATKISLGAGSSRRK